MAKIILKRTWFVNGVRIRPNRGRFDKTVVVPDAWLDPDSPIKLPRDAVVVEGPQIVEDPRVKKAEAPAEEKQPETEDDPAVAFKKALDAAKNEVGGVEDESGADHAAQNAAAERDETKRATAGRGRPKK